MKELSCSEIQNVSLRVLAEFDSFCKMKGLRYSLGYGTLIGAIRHKGFIPWDDDVDVMMPRPDYEIFCREYESKGDYILYSPRLRNSYIAYSRLCDNKDTIVRTELPWHSGVDTGVWIDIFPIDGAPDDTNEMHKVFSVAKDLYRKQFFERCAYRQRYIDRPWGLLKYLKNRFINHVGVKNIIDCALDYEAYCSRIKYGTTDHLTGISCLNAQVELHYNLSDFREFLPVEFEGKEFLSVSGYDNVLRCQYGDYMKLPPEEKRVPCHSGHKYYWKNK
ncbi:MAG: LicD family protein [Bacteroidales bacterium]|nr:LicD family protein [Bacteroidales bacterium]